MCGPDAATTCDTGSYDPNPAGAVFGVMGALKEVDRDQAGDKADQTRQRHKTQVMLAIQAG
jgi:hypothetical protein